MINSILDSGAYSAFENSTSVDIHKYMEYIDKNKIGLYLNLDVIGDVSESWRNQKIMEDHGLNPIPIFHADEEVKWLHKCLDYPYIALGGMASGSHESVRESFLDSCFDVICNTPNRMPISKVHGLGLASPLLVAKYPFYSADTASGIHYGRYGIIIIPSRNRSGKLDYLKPPHSLYITERSTAKQTEGRHFCNMSLDEKRWIKNYVRNQGFEMGEVNVFDAPEGYELQEKERFLTKEHKTVERIVKDGIVSNGVLRDYFNIDFYMNMEAAIPEYPWPYKPRMRRMF